MRDLRMAAGTGLEFKNVVFNAARDGKLRRLKVGTDGLIAALLVKMTWMI